jgi:hypothetical protein
VTALPRIPIIPTELDTLDRAIALLGERAKGLELRWKQQLRLAQLLGRYPDPETAAIWKSGLKKHRAALVTEEQLESGAHRDHGVGIGTG